MYPGMAIDLPAMWNTKELDRDHSTLMNVASSS
jgi:hypothetical protein